MHFSINRIVLNFNEISNDSPNGNYKSTPNNLLNSSKYLNRRLLCRLIVERKHKLADIFQNIIFNYEPRYQISFWATIFDINKSDRKIESILPPEWNELATLIWEKRRQTHFHNSIMPEDIRKYHQIKLFVGYACIFRLRWSRLPFSSRFVWFFAFVYDIKVSSDQIKCGQCLYFDWDENPFFCSQPQ